MTALVRRVRLTATRLAPFIYQIGYSSLGCAHTPNSYFSSRDTAFMHVVQPSRAAALAKTQPMVEAHPASMIGGSFSPSR